MVDQLGQDCTYFASSKKRAPMEQLHVPAFGKVLAEPMFPCRHLDQWEMKN